MATQDNEPDITTLSERLKLIFGEHADETLISRLFIGNSPLKGMFQVSAHPHLMIHTLKRALNLPLNGELDAFFNELSKQGVSIEPQIVEDTINNTLIELAKNAPQKKPPSGSNGPGFRMAG